MIPHHKDNRRLGLFLIFPDIKWKNHSFNIISIRKFKMRTLIFFVMVIAVLSQQCGKGGLRCGSSDCLYPTYIQGCLNYASVYQCQECQFNYKLSNGQCLYSPQNGQDCCLAFDPQSKCTQCTGGLQPNPATGICEDIKINGCIKKAGRGCEICSKDFDLINRKCVPSLPNCVDYDSNHNCLACQSNCVLRVGSCVPVVQFKDIPNCKVITEFGCGLCLDGFRIDSQGGCKPSIIGCLVHNNDGSCKLCESPFFELQDGQCAVVGCTKASQGFCQACDSNRGFVLRHKRCEIPNCLYFDKQGCSACANNLIPGSWGCKKPSGKVCLICKSDEYLTADGQCRRKDVHCVKYQGGVCTECCQSFFLTQNNQCKSVEPGCIYKNQQCVACEAPFTFAQGQCLIEGCIKYTKHGCQTCDDRLQLFGNRCGLPHCQAISNFRCSQCVSGYELDQSSQCTPVDPNCLKANRWNQCLKCKDGFMLDASGLCSTQKWGCNYVDGRCTSCRSPFVYVPQTESCEIDGCLQYFLGGCKSCDQGYSLLYNTCKLPNCLISKQGKCIECDPDYIFKADGTCVSKDEFCEKMDAYGTCIKCMSTYYYSQKDQKCIKKVPGCQYNNQGVCASCYAPFNFDQGRCIIKGCLNVQQEGCYECNYPLVVSKDKTCVIAHCARYGQNGRCSACDQGYTLNSQAICQIQDQYCQEYNQDRTACLTCVKGYRLDSQGRCEYGDEHCSFFDETGICINCDRLYFLNYFGKCQLRDPQCKVYTNGLCSLCRAYSFPKEGVCMPNMAGCRKQLSYGNCESCEDGYQLKRGNCVARITKLSWNSIDMDFFDDEDEASLTASHETFSVGVNSKLNLVPVVAKGKGQVFFSTSSLSGASYSLGAEGSNGWSVNGNSQGQFVGYQSSRLETYYAVDIQHLTGSSLTAFSIQYSMDGNNFIRVQDFSSKNCQAGSITTFYFKPVYARAIRIVVKQGIPNIRFEFYISSGVSKSSQVSTDTFIGKTVVSTVNGVERGGISTCQTGQDLCWAGVQSCEPRKIRGFSLVYKNDCQDRVTEVKVEYSTDGISFTCYDNCKPLPLSNDSFVFPTPLLAEKLHVHFVTYSGKPSFGLKFDYL